MERTARAQTRVDHARAAGVETAGAAAADAAAVDAAVVDAVVGAGAVVAVADATAAGARDGTCAQPCATSVGSRFRTDAAPPRADRRSARRLLLRLRSRRASRNACDPSTRRACAGDHTGRRACGCA